MASTNFIDKETLIQASWLNDVDAHVFDEVSSAHKATNIDFSTLPTSNTGLSSGMLWVDPAADYAIKRVP